MPTIPLNSIPAAAGVYIVPGLEGAFAIDVPNAGRCYYIAATPLGPVGVPYKITSYEDFLTYFDTSVTAPTTAQVDRDAIKMFFSTTGSIGELYIVRVTGATNPTTATLAQFIAALNTFDADRDSHGWVVCPSVYWYKSPADRVAFQSAADAMVSQIEYQWIHAVDAAPPAEAYAATTTVLADGRSIVPSMANALAATVVGPPAIAGGQTAIANWYVADTANYLSPTGASNYLGNPVLNTENRLVPLSVIQAGVAQVAYFSDSFRRAPAGVYAPIKGSVGVAVRFNRANLSALNAAHCNVSKQISGGAIAIWGERTLYKSDSAWRYIHVRVILNIIADYLEASYQAKVFSPNDGAGLTFTASRNVAIQVMTRFYQAGVLYGANPQAAFFVRCDATNNPAYDVELGKFRVDVYAAPCGVAERILVGTYRTMIGQVPTA